MRIGICVTGSTLCVLGGLYYWRLRELTVGFSGTNSEITDSIALTGKIAISVICLGLVLLISGAVALMNSSNEDN